MLGFALQACRSVRANGIGCTARAGIPWLCRATSSHAPTRHGIVVEEPWLQMLHFRAWGGCLSISVYLWPARVANGASCQPVPLFRRHAARLH